VFLIGCNYQRVIKRQIPNIHGARFGLIYILFCSSDIIKKKEEREKIRQVNHQNEKPLDGHSDPAASPNPAAGSDSGRQAE